MTTYISAQQAIELITADTYYRLEAHLYDDHDTELDFTSLSLTISETGEDYMQAAATVITDRPLNPLAQPHFRLVIDFVFVDSDQRTHDAFDFRLVLRQARHEGNEWTITLQSFESLIRDHALTQKISFNATTLLSTAVLKLIRTVLPDATLHLTITDRRFLTDGEELSWTSYSNVWAGIQEIADLAEATCFYDGNRFVISGLPASPGKPKYAENGLAIVGTVVHEINRDEFANAVQVTYDNGATALVESSDPRNGVSVVPRKLYKESIPRAGTVRQAQQRASAVLARKIIAGEKATVTLARVLPHLRPRDTIEVNVAAKTYTALIETLHIDLINATTTLDLRALTQKG